MANFRAWSRQPGHFGSLDHWIIRGKIRRYDDQWGNRQDPSVAASPIRDNEVRDVLRRHGQANSIEAAIIQTGENLR